MHKRGTEGRGERKVVVGSAEPLYGHRVEGMVERARESAEPRESRQGEKKTYLHGFYYRRVSRNSKGVDCAILSQMNLTARRALSHRALSGN